MVYFFFSFSFFSLCYLGAGGSQNFGSFSAQKQRTDRIRERGKKPSSIARHIQETNRTSQITEIPTRLNESGF